MIFKLHDQINQYKIIGLLGTGGMGEVYLVEEEFTQRKLALKTLNPKLTEDLQCRERFINEAKIMSAFNHRNIVQIHGFFSFNQVYCMIIDYVPGGSVKDLIDQIGPIPEERALKIFIQVTEGLAYAHSHGVIHRDIKPSNIMLMPDDAVKVMDFGIARLVEGGGKTLPGALIGTLVYMSPEQVRDSTNIDYKSDVYSLGVTFYEMLSGNPPYDNRTESDFSISEKIIYQPLPNPRQRYPFISDQSIELLNWMTNKQPDGRPSASSILINSQKDKHEAIPLSPLNRGIDDTVVSLENKGHHILSQLPPSTGVKSRHPRSSKAMLITGLLVGCLFLFAMVGLAIQLNQIQETSAEDSTAKTESDRSESRSSAPVEAKAVDVPDREKTSQTTQGSKQMNKGVVIDRVWLQHNIFYSGTNCLLIHSSIRCY
ncbi:MAG TPA: serine/threonine-protein kinase, partial [Candidatus Cloacimonadota bacterium]|nr:serine/threonine-protein kinase [Candidatus Cloacimonadota bacterium]